MSFIRFCSFGFLKGLFCQARIPYFIKKSNLSDVITPIGLQNSVGKRSEPESLVHIGFFDENW